MKYRLANNEVRQRAIDAIWGAPDGYTVTITEPNVTITEPKRNLNENALLHSLISQIAKQREWAGAIRDAEEWKRLFTAAWCRATNQQVHLLPALDGAGVDIVYRQTSKLSVRECADLITFIQAWAAENGVAFKAD